MLACAAALALLAILLAFVLLAPLPKNSVDTSYRDRVVKQYVEREERGELQPNGGPWFAPSFLSEWKRNNRR